MIRVPTGSGVLAEADVDTASIIDTATIPTTTKTRLLAGHAQIARFDEESPLTDAVARGSILDQVAAHLPAARVAILSDYAKGVCDRAVCRAVIAGATRAGIPTIVDPKGADFSRYCNATVITPNRSEAATVCGFPIHDSDDAIRGGVDPRQVHNRGGGRNPRRAGDGRRLRRAGGGDSDPGQGGVRRHRRRRHGGGHAGGFTGRGHTP